MRRAHQQETKAAPQRVPAARTGGRRGALRVERERRAGRAGERTHCAAAHEARRLRKSGAGGRPAARAVAGRLVAQHDGARPVAVSVGEDGLRGSVDVERDLSGGVAGAVSADRSGGRRRQQPVGRRGLRVLGGGREEVAAVEPQTRRARVGAPAGEVRQRVELWQTGAGSACAMSNSTAQSTP